MGHDLPPRPNLDHLRRQAKALLSAFESGDPKAIATIERHFPAAQGVSAERLQQISVRLADAQLAVARETGFASWPKLSRHVEQLRSLEGTWEFESLVVDGHAIPREAISASRLSIDGDRFRTESPEATYEGVFNINVESAPHEIDIEFVAGPEAGNWNFGIFRLDGDRLDFCLDLNGKPRPAGFMASRGSGHACETLRRVASTRPEGVFGGVPPAVSDQPPAVKSVEIAFEASPTLDRLQGEWRAVALIQDGVQAQPFVVTTGRRHAEKNEVKIVFGGQLIIHALIRIDETRDPIHVDYSHIGGMSKGAYQEGILRWVGDDACFCMAASGRPRPTEFESSAGSGTTLSQWKREA